MAESSVPVVLQPQELRDLLGAEDVVVDLSNLAGYLSEHIPGAVHIDAARLGVARPPVMGLLPDEDSLSRVLSEVGISPDSYVVAYDGDNGLKAARFLWTLDVIGHRRASFLDGGLAAWADAGLPLESGTPQFTPGQYPVRIGDRARADKAWILARLGDPGVVVLDARTPGEYHGTDRRALRGGHIPGAVNVDWSQAIRGGGDMRLRPLEELREIYTEAGVTPEKEIVVHCQTHQRSAHTYVVLKALGYPNVRGYPGSWSEWGNDPDAPIEN